jgi:hypothetical protein
LDGVISRFLAGKQQKGPVVSGPTHSHHNSSTEFFKVNLKNKTSTPTLRTQVRAAAWLQIMISSKFKIMVRSKFKTEQL